MTRTILIILLCIRLPVAIRPAFAETSHFWLLCPASRPNPDQDVVLFSAGPSTP